MNRSESDAALRHLGPQWFAVAMGWSGLGLAWLRARALLGAPAEGIAYGSACVAATVFGLVLVLSTLRLVRHRQAVRDDLSHPVRHAFVAAAPVSMLLLATLWNGLAADRSWTLPLWSMGAGLQFVVTAWVVGRWPRHGLQWAALTPVIFIPIVGNVVVPLGGVHFEQEALSWFFLGLGGFAWPVVVALVLVRLAMAPYPDRLFPAWFIGVAPPAVIGLALNGLQVPSGWSLGAFGVATFFLTLAAMLLPRMRALEFGMPFWAMSFPLAAYAALALRMAELHPSMRPWALAALALVSAVVLGLSLATLRGLARKTLLVPETPAAPPPGSSAVKIVRQTPPPEPSGQ